MAKVAEIAREIRTNPSAFFSVKTSTTTAGLMQNVDEEGKGLLEAAEDNVQPVSEATDGGIGRKNAKRWDFSRWLRPLGIIFSIAIIVMIMFASVNNLFHRMLSTQRSNGSHKIGIELHPRNHVYRHSTTIEHDWTITSGLLSPDGVKKQVFMVNGKFPGPTVQCRSGDKLIIHVTNQLVNESISIHFHGLQMRNANSMDGAAGFTQCPLPPRSKFTYDFDIDEEQHGTFWWHAHSQTQRGDGMYGGLVVHRPASTNSEMNMYGYRKEMLLLVGDWYHRSADEVLDWYTSVKGFGNEPVPDSLLVNGVGRFTCSMAVPARPVDCEEITADQFLGIPSSTTRVRVVNVGTLAGITLQTEIGSLTPITVDGGHAIFGSPSDSVGILYPGERMDLISRWPAHASSRSPRLGISLDRENFKYPNHALRPDQSFAAFQTPKSNSSNIADHALEKPVTHYDLALAKAVKEHSKSGVSETAAQTILLYTKTQKLAINANHPQGFMNRTSWVPQSEPLISLQRSSWDKNQLIPFISLNSSAPRWVDIIINNLDDGSHPFHLHGYDFFVLASHRSEHGWGSYSPWATEGTSSFAPNLNLDNPVLKDTVRVPRRGFVILRIRADNPGVWMLHCHVLFHQGSGMAMGIHVGASEGHADFNLSAARLCKKLDQEKG